MKTFLLIAGFFGGIILFFGFGCVIGHFLKLDKYIEENQKEKKSNLSSLKKNKKVAI